MTTPGRCAVFLLILVVAACSGAAESATSTAASSTTMPVTTATSPPPTLPPNTAATTATSTTVAAASGPRIEFRQATEDTDEYSYTISYPLLVDAAGVPVAGANVAIQGWVEESIAQLQAAATTLDTKATLTAQVAPELLNESVWSVSGVSTRFFDSAAGSVSRRHGWIVDLAAGAAITAQDLLLDGDLTPLADAALLHLIADVLGSEDALAGPDGLLPVAANFDAAWLTVSGIGVGFDEGQVAAPDAGSPAILIPFAELDVFLLKSGVLAPLTESDTLSEL